MKKQVKLALLGTMLFTGATILCNEAEKVENPSNTEQVVETTPPADLTQPQKADSANDLGKSFLTKGFEFVKSNKKILLASGVILVGCVIAYNLLVKDKKENADEAVRV